MPIISPESKRKDLIDDFLRHCSDIIPYDDTDYDEKLMKMAEHYADEIINPNSYYNQTCRLHDETLDDSLIDF